MRLRDVPQQLALGGSDARREVVHPGAPCKGTPVGSIVDKPA